MAHSHCIAIFYWGGVVFPTTYSRSHRCPNFHIVIKREKESPWYFPNSNTCKVFSTYSRNSHFATLQEKPKTLFPVPRPEECWDCRMSELNVSTSEVLIERRDYLVSELDLRIDQLNVWIDDENIWISALKVWIAELNVQRANWMFELNDCEFELHDRMLELKVWI